MVRFAPSNVVKALPSHFFIQQKIKINTKINQGIDIIDLANGNPDQPTPDYLVNTLKSAVSERKNHGYPPFHGKRSLKEAIAAFYDREYGVSINPDTEISIFHGATVGLSVIPQALLNEKDMVVIPDPYYPLYDSAISLTGANTYYVPAKEENKYLPNLKEVPDEVWKRTKLLLLNYPNNPTGAVADNEFYKTVIQLAEKYQFAVVNDFAYAAFGFSGEKPISLLQTIGAKEYGIEIYTLSKTFNMAGWRIGFAVGNKSIIQHVNRLLEHTHSSIFGAVQDTAEKALLESQAVVQGLSKRYCERLEILLESFQKIGLRLEKPSGTFFVWAKVPPSYTSESFAAALLSEANVAVSPGTGFGKNGEGYVRISLLADTEKIKEAASRIEQSGVLNVKS